MQLSVQHPVYQQPDPLHLNLRSDSFLCSYQQCLHIFLLVGEAAHRPPFVLKALFYEYRAQLPLQLLRAKAKCDYNFFHVPLIESGLEVALKELVGDEDVRRGMYVGLQVA